jgi:glycosyltransferase involved in cell wall biosynthesis
MFRFTFIPYEFYVNGEMGGPLVQANLLAKWLSELSPPDLDISFSPIRGNIPFMVTHKLKIVPLNQSSDWRHYFNDNIWPGTNPIRSSFGPNLVLEKEGIVKRIEKNKIPLVTCSEYSKTSVLDGWDYPSELVYSIPNIVDSKFQPGAKSPQPTVGWIGYDSPDRWVKGAEVIPFLAERFPHIQFEMIFALAPCFQHEWMPRPLPNVKIYSQVLHTKMPEIIQKWHILVSGSKHETGGAHVAEAMACGIPVICAGVGALPETAEGQILLEGTKRWYKYPYNWTPDTLEKYAEALDQLLSDEELYRTKVCMALKKSREYRPDKIAGQWFDFIYCCRDSL